MSSSAVPITVAVVISVLFCTIRAYYWYKARARPPPYSSDSSYDIENQAIIAGGGGGGQPLDQRPSSPSGAGGTTLTIVTSTDLSHPHGSGSKLGRYKTAATSGLPVARPSSSLYHTVIRSVSFPTQQPTVSAKAPSVARAGAGTAASAQKNTAGHLDPTPADITPTSSPGGSPCVSSTVSHNNSSEAIHPATPPSKPCTSTQTPDPAPTSAPPTPVPGLIQTAVSGSWLAMLKHQRYTRVTSPASPTPTSSPSAATSSPPGHHTTGPASDSTTAPSTTSHAPAPPMLVVQPCTPRPFAFHAPSPTTAASSPTSTTSASAPIVKPRARPHARRKSVGHGPMNLFRQMYAATPPLVETDEESEEDEAEAESERTGSGASIVSESGDSFADSLVERGRLLPAGGRNKVRRVAGKKSAGGVEGGGAGAGDLGRVGAKGGSVDRLEMAAVGEKAGAEVVDESESGSLEEDLRESEGEEKPITGDSARDAANEDRDPKSAAKSGGKGRNGAKTAGKGSASPKSVKSIKAISKKSKRSRRMSV